MSCDVCGGQGCSVLRFPTGLRECLESFFDADLSTVRVGWTPAVPALGALAFTCGERIFFAPGRYDVRSHAGVELLGHELTHVLQQRAGRVPAARARVSLVHAPALEAEADAFGRRLADWWADHPGIQARFSAGPWPAEPACSGDLGLKGSAVLQARLSGLAAFELFAYYAKAFSNREDLQTLCRGDHRRLVFKHDTLESAIEEVHRLHGPATNPTLPPPDWKPLFGRVSPEPPVTSSVPSLLSIMQEQAQSRPPPQSSSSSSSQPQSMADLFRTAPTTVTFSSSAVVRRVDKVKAVLDRVASWDHTSQASMKVRLTSTEVDDLISRASQVLTTSGKNARYEVIDNGGTEEKYAFARVIKLVSWFGSQISTGMTGGPKKPTFHVILKK